MAHNNDKLTIIDQFCSEYEAWLSSRLAGAGETDDPQGFLKWMNGIEVQKFDIDGYYKKQIETLVKQHDALMSAPHDDVLKHYQGFMSLMRLFTQAVIFELDGQDALSGLKNNVAMEKDLTIEMERLSRAGAQFCIGLARIDDFENISSQMSGEASDRLIRTVSALVKKSLRSYDEAYRIQRDHFVMCLKQSDMLGGKKAIERLRDILEKAGATYVLNGEEKPLSLSCCVAMPTTGDSIEELFENLFFDLDKQISEAGSVLTYQEMSPLQRLIKETNK